MNNRRRSNRSNDHLRRQNGQNYFRSSRRRRSDYYPNTIDMSMYQTYQDYDNYSRNNYGFNENPMTNTNDYYNVQDDWEKPYIPDHTKDFSVIHSKSYKRALKKLEKLKNNSDEEPEQFSEYAKMIENEFENQNVESSPDEYVENDEATSTEISEDSIRRSHGHHGYGYTHFPHNHEDENHGELATTDMNNEVEEDNSGTDNLCRVFERLKVYEDEELNDISSEISADDIGINDDGYEQSGEEFDESDDYADKARNQLNPSKANETPKVQNKILFPTLKDIAQKIRESLQYSVN